LPTFARFGIPATQVFRITHTVADGTPAHSFSTLLAELGPLVRNTCRTPNAEPDAPTFAVLTNPNPTQRRALELVKQIQV
jgi:hypothetical protein